MPAAQQSGGILPTCLRTCLFTCLPGWQPLRSCPALSCPADDVDAPMLRFLFVQAMQPYLRHMHAWAFTAHVSARPAYRLGKAGLGWARRGGAVQSCLYTARIHACLQCCRANLYGCPAPDPSCLLVCRL